MAQGTQRSATKHTTSAAVLLAFAMLLTALVLLPAPLARAATMGFDARPQPGSPNAELGFFKFDAAPGETVQRVLVLHNSTDAAKTIRVAACDGLAAVFGGVAYSDSDKKPTVVGSWVQMSSTSVEVPPGATVEVPFQVQVPADTSSGVHIGGLAIWEPAAATTSGSGNGSADTASTKITMVTRMVLTVFVTTPGPATPNLTISGVTTEARPDGMYAIVTITNDGTGPTSAEGTISIPSEGFQQDFTLGDMIPTASTGYPINWKTDPAAGSYAASVVLHYGENGAQTAEWSGQFEVADTELAVLADRLVVPPQTVVSAGLGWKMYALIGGLAFVVLIMGFALLRRRPASRA